MLCSVSLVSIPQRGRSGFDAGDETKGACREGSDSRKTIAVTL